MATAIGKVSESLRKLLKANLDASIKVTVNSPADGSTSTKRANLFLYRVAENPFLNNRDWLPRRSAPNQLSYPPLTLNLFYLLTAYAPLDAQTGMADAHGILGEAMRVLYENAIIPQANLDGDLMEGQVKVTLLPLDLEQLSKIWTALTKEYRLSAAYEVTYLEIESARQLPVPKRVARTGLSVRAGMRRPAVTLMTPPFGPVGTALVFSGADLAGWRATVRVGGKVAIQNQELSDDSAFTTPVPAGLLPGMYEVSVDVAGLDQFSASFEVKP